MSKTVMTVAGAVPAADLGTTLAHEHVLFDLGTYYTPPVDAPEGGVEAITADRLWWLRSHPMNSRTNLRHDDVDLASAEVSEFVSAGGRTIVDQTVAGIGPRPRDLMDVSRRTGAHVVAGTGFYVAGSYPAEVADWSQERIADRLRTELTVGIAGTDVRAGMIGELGVSAEVLPFEHRLLAAAAQVQTEQNCAVSIHTPWGPDAVRAVAAAAENAGLNPSRTSLCHLDNRFADDSAPLHELARRGFVLSLDCFGRDCYYPHIATQLPSDETRIRALVDLFAAGFGGQVLVSQDICFQHELVSRGGHGYAHILRTVIPRLERHGLGDAEVDRLLVANPREWLAG